MQNLIRRSAALFIVYAVLAVTMAGTAHAQGQPVTTRLVVPGGSASSTSILPGQSVTFEVRVDAPDKATVGTAYRLQQTSPGIAPGNFYFSITGRSIAGSPYSDAASGTPDATVLASPANRLDPDSDANLGKNTPGLTASPVAPGTNLLATTITLDSSPSTPPGVYRIQPTVGSYVTEITSTPGIGIDWPMSGAFFDVLVGATLTVTKSGVGTGTVIASSGAINCGPTCSDIYPGSTVTLTAAPSPGSSFLGWSGACSGSSAQCTVTVDAAKTVNAAFGLAVSASPPTLNKAFNPVNINANGTAALLFTITNATLNNTAQTFGFTDTLPAGLQIASPNNVFSNCIGGSVTAAPGTSTITVAGATVSATTAVPLSCTISVAVTNKAGQTNASCASSPVAFTNAGANNTTGVNNISGLSNLIDGVSQSCLAVIGQQPSVNKAFSPTTIAAGGTSVLTFTVNNPGQSGAVSNVGFVDTLPSGLVTANAAVGGTCANAAAATTLAAGMITVSSLQVPAGPSSCTVTVNITNVTGQSNPSCPAAAFTNTAGNVTVTNVLNGVTSSCLVVTAVAQPATLTKAFAPTAIVDGGSTTLTFTITNPAGNNPPQRFSFTDMLPSGLRVAADPAITSTCTGGAINAVANSPSIAVIGSIVAASTASPTTCTISVDVTNVAGQGNASCAANPVAFTNSAANIAAVSNLTANAIAPACVVVTGVAFNITKTPSVSSIVPGSPLTFTITVTNNGPDSGNGALLSDPVINGFNATGVTCTAASAGAACPDLANLTLANLQGAGIALTTFPANSTMTFEVAGTFTASSGIIANVATITSPPGVPPQTHNATAAVSVPESPPENIPTLSEWMLALLSLMLGAVALRTYRRRV